MSLATIEAVAAQMDGRSNLSTNPEPFLVIRDELLGSIMHEPAPLPTPGVSSPSTRLWSQLRHRRKLQREWRAVFDRVRRKRLHDHPELMTPTHVPLSAAHHALLRPGLEAGVRPSDTLLFAMTQDCLIRPYVPWSAAADLTLIAFLIRHGAQDRVRHLWGGPHIAAHGRGQGQRFSVIELAVRQLRPEILQLFPEPRTPCPKGRRQDCLLWTALMCPLPYRAIHRHQDEPRRHIAYEVTYPDWARRLEETVEWVLQHEDDRHVDHRGILAEAIAAEHPHGAWLRNIHARETLLIEGEARTREMFPQQK